MPYHTIIWYDIKYRIGLRGGGDLEHKPCAKTTLLIWMGPRPNIYIAWCYSG